MEARKEDIVSFSFTSALFGGILASFIVFGIMMHFFVTPMLEETYARIEIITFNESKFNELKIEFEILKNNTKKLEKNVEDKTEILWSEKGNWECTDWKEYDGLDCVIATGVRNASIIENSTTCQWFDDRSSGNYILPKICTEWNYRR